MSATANNEQNTRNSQARDAALAAATNVAVEPTSLVSFRSGGRLLLTGDAVLGQQTAYQLQPQGLVCCVLATSGSVAEYNRRHR